MLHSQSGYCLLACQSSSREHTLSSWDHRSLRLGDNTLCPGLGAAVGSPLVSLGIAFDNLLRFLASLDSTSGQSRPSRKSDCGGYYTPSQVYETPCPLHLVSQLRSSCDFGPCPNEWETRSSLDAHVLPPRRFEACAVGHSTEVRGCICSAIAQRGR
jgi:hypothetical protein